MASTGSGSSNNITTTSSDQSQAIAIPEPRFLNLPRAEYVLYLAHIEHVHICDDDIDVSSEQAIQKSNVLRRMVEEQKRSFPAMAEEEDIINQLKYAKDVKEDWEELVRELRLEAENEIDLERQRS